MSVYDPKRTSTPSRLRNRHPVSSLRKIVAFVGVPGSLIVANNLASLLADRRTDKASLDRANSLALLLKNTDVPQFKDTLGWVSYQRQDYRTALPLLEDAAKALPNLALVRFHLGMAYLATGQDDKASNEFSKARTLAPKDTELGAKIDAALKSRPEKAKG